MSIALIYHHQEREIADEWADLLRQAGYAVTLAPLGFEVGSEAWRASARSDLEAAEAAFLLLTHKALADEWVEWRYAVAREQHTPIYPVMFEQLSYPLWLAEVQIAYAPQPGDRLRIIGQLASDLPPPAPQIRCFISYARPEREFAARLAYHLRGHRIEVWRDEDDIPAGASWAQEIQQALEACTHVLFIATPRSIKSPNVLDEVYFALDKDKVVVPIRLEECELPLRVHRAQWVDFRGDYQAALSRLLDQLGATQPNRPSSELARSSRAAQALARFWPYVALLALAVVILLVVVWRQNSSSFPRASPEPAALERPERAPPLATTIGIALGPECLEGQDELAGHLEEQFPDTTPPLLTKQLAPVSARETARSEGEKDGVDLVIWCATEEGSRVFHFEIMAARGAPEVYEPTALQLSEPSNLQVQQLAYAMGHYVHRSYDKAAPSFDSLVRPDAASPDSAPIYLMLGNSLVFSGAYSKAADAFEQAIDERHDWAQAHHNLGVAQMNRGWEESEFQDAWTSFTTTLKLDPGFALSYVARGLIGKWRTVVMAGEPVTTLATLQNAQDACQQALDASDPRVASQAAVCLANAQIVASRMHLIKDPLDVESMRLEGLARPHWALPRVTQGAARYELWKTTNDPVTKTVAERELVAGLSDARDDVHLEHSKQVYDTALSYLLKLQGPLN